MKELWFREFTDEDRHIQDKRKKQKFLNHVVIDPSGFRLLQMARTHREDRGGLRGIFWENVQYWWHAYYGTHFDGWRLLTTSNTLRSALHEAELHCTKNGSVYLTTRNEEAFEFWLNRKPFLNAFKDGYFYGPVKEDRT